MNDRTPEEVYRRLRAATPARVALGRSGSGLPTASWLSFSMAHALARDAVHAALDLDALHAAIAATGHGVIRVESAAADRQAYLLRPDLGRQISDRAVAQLPAAPHPCDLAIVVGDGLSATAVAAHAAPLIAALEDAIAEAGWTLAPVVLARQARVALADEIGARLKARATLMLIGERPGLSSPDSLGAYITVAPRPGRSDAERNCVSNIRPEGLSYARAAFKIGWLLREALARGASGVALKDESDVVSLAPPPARKELGGP